MNATKSATTLTVEDGFLYTPCTAIVDELTRQWADGEDVLLIGFGPGGEPFTVRWPEPNEDQLKAALYGARETGLLPKDTERVALPDGTLFDIE